MPKRSAGILMYRQPLADGLVEILKREALGMPEAVIRFGEVLGEECVRQMTAEYQARRDRVVERLSGLPAITPLVPEGGMFVMVDVRALTLPSDDVRRFLLREAGVVVIHGSAYGPGGEGTLRVSFAAGGETLDRGLERLREGLARLSSGEGRTVPR